MNSKITNKLVAGALIGVIVICVGTLDFAFSDKVSANTKSYINLSNNREDDTKENTKHHSKKEYLRNRLDKLVESKTITKEQEEKIIDHIEKKHKERKEEIEKLKSMNEQQRNEYFNQVKANTKGGFFQELIDEKVINEKQAEEIKKVMHKNHKHKFNEKKLKSKLDEHVKAGIISKNEEDKIIAYTKEKVKYRKAQGEKIKKMTPGERRVYFLQKELEPKKGFFKDLVDQGILSQEKADALKKAMKAQRDHD
jgi:hypothetical protein